MQKRIRKYYAETERGLLHIQETGAGPVLVLINMTSWAAALMDDVLPTLAALGYRALYLDIMGYGRSDKRDGDWSIDDFATNIEEALAITGVHAAGYVTGHMASVIGIELGCRAPPGLKGLVIEGMPLIGPPARAAHRAKPRTLTTPWTEDGSHVYEYWRAAWRSFGRLDPTFALPADPSRRFRETFLAFLQVGCFEPNTMSALAHYEIEQKLRQVALPTLVMCGDHDWNLKYHAEILGHLKNARELRWPGVAPLHSLSIPSRASEYAQAIDGFFAPLLDPRDRSPATAS